MNSPSQNTENLEGWKLIEPFAKCQRCLLRDISGHVQALNEKAHAEPPERSRATPERLLKLIRRGYKLGQTPSLSGKNLGRYWAVSGWVK